MAGAAGRHRGLCRCGADSRDSLRFEKCGREIKGKDVTQEALRAGGGGRRAKFINKPEKEEPVSSLKASLSPLATGEASEHVINRSGAAAETVATELQLLIAKKPIRWFWAPGQGWNPTAVDRQLGLGYGPGDTGRESRQVWGDDGFCPPDIQFVPLAEAINKVRTVPVDSEFMQIARSIGINLGREL